MTFRNILTKITRNLNRNDTLTAQDLFERFSKTNSKISMKKIQYALINLLKHNIIAATDTPIPAYYLIATKEQRKKYFSHFLPENA